MSEFALPDTGRFRSFPTRIRRQRFREDSLACAQCLGGTCCQSEDAIYLTALDVLRLSAYFDLSPVEFLKLFTQERFAEGPFEPYRRRTIDDPDSSVVTYLRRRSNRSYSPCIFLKYVRDPDGTPRRVCGVYAARPLACRDYYHQHCKTRATGELAALQAHVFELIGRGEITLGLAKSQREELRPRITRDAPLSLWLLYAVWTEAWRALSAEDVNEEGCRSYSIEEFQDPPDLKINRLLSKPLVRLEERYGFVPHDEQLQIFSQGLSFVSSPDRRRILRIAASPPSRGFFDDGDYPFFAANRLVVPGMQRPTRFERLQRTRREQILDGVGDARAFPHHRDPRVRATTVRELWRAALNAADGLVTLAGYVASLGRLLEEEPPGTLEWEILWCMQQVEASDFALPRLHPGLGEVRRWARKRLGRRAAITKRPSSPAVTRRVSPRAIRRLLDTQLPDGTWSTDPAVRELPPSQAAYLRSWLHGTTSGLIALRIAASTSEVASKDRQGTERKKRPR